MMAGLRERSAQSHLDRCDAQEEMPESALTYVQLAKSVLPIPLRSCLLEWHCKSNHSYFKDSSMGIP